MSEDKVEEVKKKDVMIKAELLFSTFNNVLEFLKNQTPFKGVVQSYTELEHGLYTLNQPDLDLIEEEVQEDVSDLLKSLPYDKCSFNKVKHFQDVYLEPFKECYAATCEHVNNLLYIMESLLENLEKDKSE